MKEFTDEQIIEIFKYCAESDCDDCYKCTARKDGKCAIPDLGAQVVRIINRQAAEIENLKQVIDEEDKEILKLQKRIIFWREDLNYQPEKIKSEAIKEFAEKVKKEICKNTYAGFDKKGNPVNIWEAKAGFKDIDNLFRRQGFIHKTSARTKFA